MSWPCLADAATANTAAPQRQITASSTPPVLSSIFAQDLLPSSNSVMLLNVYVACVIARESLRVVTAVWTNLSEKGFHKLATHSHNIFCAAVIGGAVHGLIWKSAFFLGNGWEPKRTSADRAQFTPVRLLSEASGHKHVILPGQEVISLLWAIIDSWQTSSRFNLALY